MFLDIPTIYQATIFNKNFLLQYLCVWCVHILYTWSYWSIKYFLKNTIGSIKETCASGVNGIHLI